MSNPQDINHEMSDIRNHKDQWHTPPRVGEYLYNFPIFGIMTSIRGAGIRRSQKIPQFVCNCETDGSSGGQFSSPIQCDSIDGVYYNQGKIISVEHAHTADPQNVSTVVDIIGE
jgi:hypothetical protein